MDSPPTWRPDLPSARCLPAMPKRRRKDAEDDARRCRSLMNFITIVQALLAALHAAHAEVEAAHCGCPHCGNGHAGVSSGSQHGGGKDGGKGRGRGRGRGSQRGDGSVATAGNLPIADDTAAPILDQPFSSRDARDAETLSAPSSDSE